MQHKLNQASFILLFVLTNCITHGQTLQQGVFASVTLTTHSRIGHPVVDCYGHEFDFSPNCFPYVSGMNLFLVIDSITGVSDSIQILRYPDYINVILHANDSIPVEQGSNNIYVYFLGTDTLYTSFIASGTPQIAGESYYCLYNSANGVFSDGCGNSFNWIQGGNGLLDTIKGCNVLSPLADNEMDKSQFQFYPNPATELLKLYFSSSLLKEIKVYDLLGKSRHEATIGGKQIDIDVANLEDGVYIIEVTDGNKIVRRKFVRR